MTSTKSCETPDEAEVEIDLTRSGGVAGHTAAWRVRAQGADSEEWKQLLQQCPWSAKTEKSVAHPDRYTFQIEVGNQRISLPEERVLGAWRQLVNRVMEEGQRRAPQP